VTASELRRLLLLDGIGLNPGQTIVQELIMDTNQCFRFMDIHLLASFHSIENFNLLETEGVLTILGRLRQMKPMANTLSLATTGNDLGLNGNYRTPAADEANGQYLVFGNNWQRSGAEQPIASIPMVGWGRNVCV
jgi:hypothetical protein